MSQITILLLYVLAAVAFMTSRLPRFSSRARPLFVIACIVSATGIVMHAEALLSLVLPAGGFDLSIGNAVALIGLELAAIALLASLEPTLRGMSGGMILLAAATTVLMGPTGDAAAGIQTAWQVRAHILVALASYGLLSVGTIVAIFALIQENRLRAARISSVNQLFAPLETTEKLLFAVATAGFIGLTLAIVSGSTFVNDLLQQHLAHKFALSVLAWLVFGVLLGGRFFSGWRGKRAVHLYLGGYLLLCLAYFGSRVILEVVFGRSWS